VLPNDQTDYSTRTLAGYAMVNFGTEWGNSSLTGNVGARVVNVKNSSSGYFSRTRPASCATAPSTTEQFGRFTAAARNSPAFCPRST
jgi:hypothetical protein